MDKVFEGPRQPTHGTCLLVHFVVQPELVIGDDGGYDALAENVDIGIGDTVSGFVIMSIVNVTNCAVSTALVIGIDPEAA